MKIEQKIKPIPPLQIGNGKLKQRVKINWSFKSLKDWFLGITINWQKEGNMKIKEIGQLILKGLDEALDNAKDKILELAKTEIENKEKKAQLDGFLIDFIMEKVVMPINFMGFDVLAENAIMQLLKALVPVITQKIFDLMKSKFELQ